MSLLGVGMQLSSWMISENVWGPGFDPQCLGQTKPKQTKMKVVHVHTPLTRSWLPFIIPFLPENDMNSPPNIFLHPATTHGVLPPWTSGNRVANAKLPLPAEADTKHISHLPFPPSFHKNSSPLKFHHFPHPFTVPSPVSTTLPSPTIWCSFKMYSKSLQCRITQTFT